MAPRTSKSTARTGSTQPRGKRAKRIPTPTHAANTKKRAASNSGARAAARGAARSGRDLPAHSKRGRRADASASYAVTLLRQDHRAVEEALEEFESAAREDKAPIAARICKLLTVHTQIEEELLYPAARDALHPQDAHLVAEARVEHASVKSLIGQIEGHETVDEQDEAKVTVLGEYVRHHVGEEERELFPKLERTPLDLQALGERLTERKRELMGEEAGEDEAAHEEEGIAEGSAPTGRSRPGGRGQRPTALHARRR